MEDAIKSIKAYLYEKATSPLAGAFATSWVVLNHRVLFILFSDEHYSKSFAAIDQYFGRPLFGWQIDNTYVGTALYCVVFPAALALAYIYAYPQLAEPVYEHALKKRQKLRELRQEAEKQRLLSQEESAELFARMELIRTEAESKSAQYAQEIDALNLTIRKLNTDLSELNDQSIDVADDHPQPGDKITLADARNAERHAREIVLTEEDADVLSAISAGRMNSFRNSKKVSSQRIALVQDRLKDYGLIGIGSNGAYAKALGRAWLDTRGLLK